jgi:hypothetical protein
LQLLQISLVHEAAQKEVCGMKTMKLILLATMMLTGTLFAEPDTSAAADCRKMLADLNQASRSLASPAEKATIIQQMHKSAKLASYKVPSANHSARKMLWDVTLECGNGMRWNPAKVKSMLESAVLELEK